MKNENLVPAFYSRSFAKQYGSFRRHTKKGRSVSVTHLCAGDRSLQDIVFVGFVRIEPTPDNVVPHLDGFDPDLSLEGALSWLLSFGR